MANSWFKKEKPLLGMMGSGGGLAQGSAAEDTGHVASGGIISDYTSGSDKYRAHIFTTSGSFVISELSNAFPATADYFLVGGGGGGGGGHPTSSVGAGGGGGGGAIEGASLSVTAQTYNIVVGTGGQGECWTGDDTFFAGYNGNDSSISTPTVGIVTAYGGGGGAQRTPAPGAANARSGGAGGGSAYSGPRLGYGLNPTAPAPVMPTIGPGLTHPWPGPLQQGYDGGDTPADAENPAGAGGGGAGGPGTNGDNGPLGAAGGDGGGGKATVYAYGPTAPQYYGGGGGGAAGTNPTKSDPIRGDNGHGGGKGAYGGGPWVSAATGPDASYELQGESGKDSFGGGGGGGGCTSPLAPGPETQMQGGYGGAGTVIIRYKIAEAQTATAAATGGAISFAGGKTIHTFVYSSTFNNPTSLSNVDFLVVGGGGAGSGNNGGGGGGGGIVYSTGQTFPVIPTGHLVEIGQGGASSSSFADNSFSPTVPGGGRPGNPSYLVVSPTVTATAGYGGAGGAYSGGTHGGRPGNNSTISGGPLATTVVIGGAGGGGIYSGPPTGSSGGSGGSASGGSTNTTGYAGGPGAADNPTGQNYGGGGGASAVGQPGAISSPTTPTICGDGGAGYTCAILGTSYVWGGGGGSAGCVGVKGGNGGTGGGGGGGQAGTAAAAGTGGTGGLGAGQSGNAKNTPTIVGTGPRAYGIAGYGAANTGGGGGGNGAKVSGSKGFYGGRGGSGIVIISYPT